MIYFLERNRESKKVIPDGKWYKLICKWKDIHKADDHYKKFVSLLDLDKFTIDHLVANCRNLHRDFSELYLMNS